MSLEDAAHSIHETLKYTFESTKTSLGNDDCLMIKIQKYKLTFVFWVSHETISLTVHGKKDGKNIVIKRESPTPDYDLIAQEIINMVDYTYGIQ